MTDEPQEPTAPPPEVGEAETTNWKTTLVILGLVVALGVWVALGEGQSLEDVERDKKRLFPNLEAEAEVVRVVVERPDGRLVLARDAVPEEEDDDADDPATRWRVEEPVADDADPGAVTGLLNRLQFAEWTEGPSPEVGLGEVELTARLERADDEPLSFEVGAPRVDGTRPLRREGDEGAALVRESVFADLLAPAWTYRRKDLLTVARADATRVEVASRAGPESGPAVRIDLAYDGTFWRLGGPDGEVAHRARTDALLETVLGLRAASAVDDDPDAEAIEVYGLTPEPRLTVEVAAPGDAGGEAVERLALGAAVEGGALRYGRLEGRPFVYEVDVADLETLLGAGREAFRTDELLPVVGNEKTVTGFAVSFADGGAYALEKEEPDWRFAAPPDAEAGAPQPKADFQAAEDLAERLVGLEVRDRVGPAADQDLEALGLAPEPRARIALIEGTLRQEVQVGGPLDGHPGVHYVRRTGEPRVYTAELGGLLVDLEEAPLALLDPTLLRVSVWDAEALRIVEPGGGVLLAAEAVLPEGEPESKTKWEVTEQPTDEPADPDKFMRFLEGFEKVNALRYVARDTPAARARYGLDAPTRVAFTVEGYAGDAGAIETTERVLLVGRREDDYVYALNPDHAPAIGLIDAGFLDQIARGFAKETRLLETTRYEIRRFVAELDGAPVLTLRKPEASWRRGPGEGALVSDREVDEIQDLLAYFERVEVARARPATKDAIAGAGLDAPAMRIEIGIKPFSGDDPRTEVLLIGARAGERERWAMLEGGEELGALFDEPLRALKDYVAEEAPDSMFPPVAPNGGGD